MNRSVFAIALVLAGIACVGCRNNSVVSADGIEIESVRSEVPDFKRHYRATLAGREAIKIEITMHSRYFYFWPRASHTRPSDGKLTQENGNQVYFDPEKVADKILDPILVPLVEERCKQILAMDKAFIESKPKEFIDESGVTWERKP